jgi:4-amino-4-deoxy-L-arabinose transferase-like glycosyltransferase
MEDEGVSLNLNHKKLSALLFLLLLGCSYFFFFHNVGSYSLKEPDEGRYAEIPREMVESGDLIVPHLNYTRYFEKPPLLYWVTAASYRVFGVSEWSFRLPNALVALACVVVLYLAARRWFTVRTALLAAFVLMSSFGFWVMARGVTTDMLLSFLLFTSLVCFYQFYREKQRLFLYLFYISLALAVLTKGPVGVVLLIGTILIFLFLEKRLSFLRDLLSLRGILLFLIVAAPWFVAISLKEREFFQFFFIDQNLLRFFTSKHKRSGPVYYFLPVLLGGLFPWSLFVPRAVARLWRVPELKLLFLWSAVVFIFFSVSGSKLPPYILPLYPAMALVIAYLFDAMWSRTIGFVKEPIIYALFFLCLAVVGVGSGSGLLNAYLHPFPDILAISESVRGLSIITGLVSAILAVIFCFPSLRSFCALFTGLGAFSLVVIIALMFYTGVIDSLTTTKAIAREIERLSGPDAVVVNYGAFDETLPFYLSRRIYIADFTGELEMGAKYDDTRKYFLSKDEFAAMVQSGRSVFVVTKMKRFPVLQQLGIDTTRILARQDNRVLLANPRALRQ